MNSVEKIKNLRELEMQKFELEKKLAFINRNIKEQQMTCLHIDVNLGKYMLYDRYCCILCGEENIEKDFEPEYIIHAENYLPQYDINDEKQCNNKFDHIQTLALGLLKDNPNMSREELVDKLNNLIQLSISFRESQSGSKLVKTRTPKK